MVTHKTKFHCSRRRFNTSRFLQVKLVLGFFWSDGLAVACGGDAFDSVILRNRMKELHDLHTVRFLPVRVIQCFSEVMLWLFLLGESFRTMSNSVFGPWQVLHYPTGHLVNVLLCRYVLFLKVLHSPWYGLCLFFPNLAGHELLRVRTSPSDLALHTIKPIAHWNTIRRVSRLSCQIDTGWLQFAVQLHWSQFQSESGNLVPVVKKGGFESTCHDFVTVLISGTALQFCSFIQIQQGSILLPIKVSGTLEFSSTSKPPSAIRFAAPWAKQVGML